MVDQARAAKNGGGVDPAVAASVSGGLHAVYDRILEKPLPLSFGRAIGALVMRDLYPFSTDFGVKSRYEGRK